MKNVEYRAKFEQALANGAYARWIRKDFLSARRIAYQYLMMSLDSLVGHIRIALNIDIHGGPR